MSKIPYSIIAITVVTIVLFGTYFLFEMKCFGFCYVGTLKPLFLTLLALLPTLVLLLFFSNKIFTSWSLWIGWWYVSIILLVTLNNDHESNFSPFAYDTVVIYYGMGLLFLFTLLYAGTMRYRARGSQNP